MRLLVVDRWSLINTRYVVTCDLRLAAGTGSVVCAQAEPRVEFFGYATTMEKRHSTTLPTDDFRYLL